MTKAFAPNDNRIPEPLRRRLESWQGNNVPRTQYQQYGPLTNLFCSILDLSKYMVKPQALIRTMALDRPEADRMIIQDVLRGGIVDHPQDLGDEDMAQTLRRLSIDSNHALVNTEQNQRRYPDFAITTYGIDRPDRIKIVFEIGSVGREEGKTKATASDKTAVLFQLSKYMTLINEDSGVRREGKLIGVAIIGTEVCILKTTNDGKVPSPHLLGKKRWISIYSPSFLKIFNF